MNKKIVILMLAAFSINTAIAQKYLSDYTSVDSVILLKHLESKSYSTNIVSTQYGRNVVQS